MPASDKEGTTTEFDKELGKQIRRARKLKGLSLQALETLSYGNYKASVVGAYERGDRAMSVNRLVGICAFFDSLPEELLAKARGRATSVQLSLFD